MNIQRAAFLMGFGFVMLGCGDSGSGGAGGAGGQPVAGNGNGNGGEPPMEGGAGEGGVAAGGSNAGGGELGGEGGEGGGRVRPADVVWSNVVISPNCFLFSDPDQLGTDVTWSEGDASLTLTFEQAARSYVGPLERSTLVLQGDHDGDFDGEVWKYQEIFDGAVVDGVFQGAWTYSECNFTAAPETCPADGGCVGSADFTIAMPADDADR